MIDILFVNDIANGGGTEKVLQEITANLSDSEYRITVLTFKKEENFYKYYKGNIQYWYLYDKDMLEADTFVKKCINKLKRLRRNEYIKRNIRKAKFDIAVSIKEGYVMKYVSNLSVPKKNAWIHTDFSVFHWSGECFKSGIGELECMRSFDKVVCVSQNVMKNVKKYVGDSGNIIILENPINERAILEKSYEKQDIIKRNEGKMLFVTVGRLCREKGYDMLIDACKMLNDKGYADLYEVWIVGGGECGDELRKQMTKSNISNIIMLGQQTNPYKFLKVADWFISTSRAEGYAIAPQEAAVLGIPIIATDCSGVRELLGDSEYGIVTEINTQAIFEAMQRVIMDKQCMTIYKDKIVERSSCIKLDARMDKIKQILR